MYVLHACVVQKQLAADLVLALQLLLIPTWLSSVGFTACNVIFVNHGGDRHIWDTASSNFVPAVHNAWVAQIIYLISTTCIKISVLLFYRRLTAGAISKFWKYATIGAIYFTIAYFISFVLALIFSCSPTDAYWLSYDPDFLSTQDWSCVDAGQLNIAMGLFSVVTDLYAVLLPCLMLRNFDAPRRRKIALNVVFAFGLIVVVAGSVRTFYFSKLSYTLDETWLGFDIFVWSDLEIHLAIICASAPALRVLFRKYLADPLSRAMHTAKHSVSGSRSAARTSQHTQHGGVVHYPMTHSHSMSDAKSPENFTTFNEYSETKAEVQQHYDEADDRARLSPVVHVTSPSEHPVAIRTPADFENYALQNLQRNRPFPSRPSYLRPESETSVYPRPTSDTSVYADMNEPPTHPFALPR